MAFYRFIWKRINTNTKMMFFISCMLTLTFNASTLIIPLIQRSMIRNIGSLKEYSNTIVAYGGVCVIGVFTLVFESALLNLIDMRIKRTLQEEMFENSLKEKNSISEAKGPGALMVSIFGDSEQIAQIVQNNIFDLIIKCFTIIIIIMITLKWTYLFAGIAIITYIVVFCVQLVMNRLSVRQFNLGREKVYECNPVVLESIENRESILGYSFMQGTLSRVYGLFDDRDWHFKRVTVYDAISQSVINGSKSVAIVLYFIGAVEEIRLGKLDFATFTALLSYFSIIFNPIGQINEYISNKEKFNMLSKKIAPCMKSRYYTKLPTKNTLELVDCSYSYDKNDNMQLNDVSLEIDKKIAIVGVSGEGKTTIIKTILGDLTLDKGKCLLGKEDVSQISKNLIYSIIRYYPQIPEIYNEDLEFNVALDKRPLSQEEYNLKEKNIFEQIRKCILEPEKVKDDSANEIISEFFMTNQCHLKEYSFLKNLNLDMQTLKWLSQIYVSKRYYIKEKYDKLISELSLDKLQGRKLGQRGKSISGGEKNRIALARFLLPEQGNFFVMDEPFTSLDSISENICIEVLNKYSSNMKGIIISHKIDMLNKCTNEICILDGGTIIDKGSHEKLLKSCELYRNLWDKYKKEIN